MTFKSNTRSGAFLLAAALTGYCAVGCSNDNRTVTADEMKQAAVTRQKFEATTNMPDSAKKELESHMGGPPFDPAAAARETAIAHGAKIDSHTRTH